MKTSDYDRITQAITYLGDHVHQQPSLEDVATHVHMSPYHFQRLFSRWAGISPKKFLQVLTLESGKHFFVNGDNTLDITDKLGLSSSSRLHDHFVTIEAATPGEFKNQGRDLCIDYGVHDSLFGEIFIAQTQRGICRIAFLEKSDPDPELQILRNEWPLAEIRENRQQTQQKAKLLFSNNVAHTKPLSLYVVGTNFQIAVWRALLRIPLGGVTSYSKLAAAIGKPASSRAVGNAVGKNPIAFAIPCHRVIQQSGALGGYRWDPQRKRAIQCWERLQICS